MAVGSCTMCPRRTAALSRVRFKRERAFNILQGLDRHLVVRVDLNRHAKALGRFGKSALAPENEPNVVVRLVNQSGSTLGCSPMRPLRVLQFPLPSLDGAQKDIARCV